MDLLHNFTEHFDKHKECKSVLASESGKFNEERMSGHHLTLYRYDKGVEIRLILSSRYSSTCLPG